MDAPHIILIHADQHRYDCVGVNGHKLVQTPNLDRLANEGVNFSHAFTPTPICSPARASLMTSQWPSQHGCLSITHTEIYKPGNGDLPKFSHSLKEAGYQLGYVAKYHQEFEGTPLDFGFDEFHPESEYGPWRKAQGLPPRPHKNKWFGELDPDATANQTRLGWGATCMMDMMDRFSQTDKPMFLRWDPTEPHLPNIVPEPYFSMYDSKDIEPWPSYEDTLAGKPYIQSQQRRTWEVDQWNWPDDWAPMVSRYLGDISLLDAQVGRLLDKLDELGMADNTLIIYTADHGDLCGGHGMIDKHFVMYDDVMRIPMMMRWPEKFKHASTCEAFVSHELDIAATICDAAGCAIPQTFEGRSLLPVVGGDDPNPPQEVFGMWHGGQFGSYCQRMVRTRQWKYIWNPTAEDELYNIDTDPGELLNVACDEANASVLKDLRGRLVQWMDDIDDQLLNPWTQRQLERGLTY